MSKEYSLCLQGNVYVLRVQFMSPEYSLCPQSYSLCPQEYSLCPNSTVYVFTVQFMSLIKYSLCPQSAVYFLRVQFMPQ